MANKNTEKDVVAQMEEFLPVMDNWNLRIVSSFNCLLNVYVNWQYLIPVCQQGIGVSEKRDGRPDQVARRLVWILLWGQQELQAGGVLQVILPVHQQLQEGGGRQRQEEGAGEERGAQEAAAGERAGQAEIRILPRWEKYLQWRWKIFAVVWCWHNQLEKLEAARSAYLWLPFLALLSLTGPYWALIGLTGFYFALLGLTGPNWA